MASFLDPTQSLCMLTEARVLYVVIVAAVQFCGVGPWSSCQMDNGAPPKEEAVQVRASCQPQMPSAPAYRRVWTWLAAPQAEIFGGSCLNWVEQVQTPLSVVSLVGGEEG